MATIVQNYGPIYGEVVNGTVQGRPNGSVYVPISNTIQLIIDDSGRYVKNNSTTHLYLCSSTGTNKRFTTVAVSQDLASNIFTGIYSSPDCADDDLIGFSSGTAGIFNQNIQGVRNTTSTTIVSETKYYIRAQLMNNGVPVATSDVIELTGWVAE